MEVKNDSGQSQVWVGQTIADQATYQIQTSELLNWQNNDKVIADLTSGDLLIGDGIAFKNAGSEAVQYLLMSKNEVDIQNLPAFASKKILINGVLKSLFKRVHGASGTIGAGQTVDIDFTIPYAQCKFSGAEIFGTELGDTVDYLILDDANNTYSGAPGSNYQLNQFGFAVRMPGGDYQNTSNYDADLYYGMIVRCRYTNNGQSSKPIHTNLWLHEVKN